ncbi:MAG: deoxyribodipyrimidine photo-lyase, partial [Planctomycetota bacterium]
MTHLVWFRNDLRTHDHAALHRACQTANKLGGSVLGIYVVDPVWFGETRFGFPRCGDFRQRFLRESLIDLAERMNRLGSHLIITHGDTGDCLANNIELLGGGKVFFHEEFGTEERELELRVKIILEARGIEWSSKPPSALYDLEQLPFPIDEIPELFTTFRKQVEKRAEVAEPLAAPESIPCAKALLNKAQSAGVPLESIACIGGNPDMSPKQSFTFRGGDTAGLGRLSQYLWETDAVATYFDTRNGMLRDLDSTKFSPWL